MYSSRTTSPSGSPVSLSTTAFQPFAPLQRVVASGHSRQRPPPRPFPNSYTRPKSRKVSKPKPSVSTHSSSTSVTSDSASSVYSIPPSQPPTVIPSKQTNSLPIFLKYRMHSRNSFASDEDDDEDGEEHIYTRKSSSASLRTRFMASRIHENEPKGITTTPGLLGAGETETEGEGHHVRPNIPAIRVLPILLIIPAQFTNIPHCSFIWPFDPAEHAPAIVNTFSLRIFTLAFDCTCIARHSL
jgi:hypothetical protein